MRKSVVIDQRRLENAVSAAITIDLEQQLSDQGMRLGGPIIIENIPLVGHISLLLDDGVETIEIQQD